MRGAVQLIKVHRPNHLDLLFVTKEIVHLLFVNIVISTGHVTSNQSNDWIWSPDT